MASEEEAARITAAEDAEAERIAAEEEAVRIAEEHEQEQAQSKEMNEVEEEEEEGDYPAYTDAETVEVDIKAAFSANSQQGGRSVDHVETLQPQPPPPPAEGRTRSVRILGPAPSR